MFESTVSSAALLSDASETRAMHDINDQPMGAWNLFAATYPMRPLLLVVGYACAGVLGLVMLARILQIVMRQ